MLMISLLSGNRAVADPLLLLAPAWPEAAAGIGLIAEMITTVKTVRRVWGVCKIEAWVG